MFWKIILLCAFGGQIINAENDLASSTSVEQQLQDDTFRTLHTQTKALWSATPSDQNIPISPLSSEAGLQMVQMKLYYESLVGVFYSKNDFLKKAYALAGILDKMSLTTNAKLKFVNSVFYDQSKTSKQLLNDLKTYYHAEAYEVSFNSEAAVLAVVNEWLNNVTKGRSPKIESFPLVTGMTNLQSSLISYTNCWDTPKIWTNFIKLLKFKNSNSEFEIETFNAKETIGYYNNAEQKYEAIRLPFKKGEFAMAVVLPNQDQSLESIVKLTANDHQQILQRVSENYENIDYAIPFMNLTQMTVNENGTAINGDDAIVCNWPTKATQEIQEINKIDYKPFYVNRPFAVYIYHEKTKFVVMYGLINNPALGTIKFRSLQFQVTITNDKTDVQFER